MTALTIDRRHGRRALLLAAGAVLLALCVTVVLAGASAGPADAARAGMLGKTKKAPRPDCPERTKGGRVTHPCEAVGKMTAFQLSAGGSKGVFKAPRDGRLVGWSVDLSRPKPSEQRFFDKVYDGKPNARIAVLQKTQGKKYRLKQQGPPTALAEHLGTKPIFTLGAPLRLRKGDILGITIPGWLPFFSTGVAANNKWLGSRASKRCDVNIQDPSGERNLRRSKPQTEVGSTRVYGCRYVEGRLLYWGYFVAD